MEKRIVIAGGTGFLGTSLSSYFENKGFTCIILSRQAAGAEKHRFWDGKTLGPWTKCLEGAFALINLSGKSVNCRYTPHNKALIRSSRLESTHVLGKAIQKLRVAPKFWFNSSTATIYEDTRGDAPANTEAAGRIADDFSVLVAKDWEAAFWEYETPDTRKIALRTSIVYGKSGGAFPVILDLAQKGLCSPQAGGEQWISWIHEDDFCRVISFLMEHEQEGIFNITSPNFVKNKDMYFLLKDLLSLRWTIPQPVWLLKFGARIMGTETELILKSRKVYPERLLNLGFSFRYPSLEEALRELCGHPPAKVSVE